MNQVTASLVTLHRSRLDATARLTAIVLTGAEHLLETHFYAAKATFANGVQQARVVAGAKDFGEFTQVV